MVKNGNWHFFEEFGYLTDKGRRRRINEIMEQDDGIAMASEVLMTITKDEVEQARLMSELKYELDTRSVKSPGLIPEQ